MKSKWKKIISLAAAAACCLPCTEGVLAADARSIAEWREYMTKPFSAGDWATVLDIASEDARDITQETVDVEISVDENDIHDLHYEILGIQTEMADGYNKYFDNGDIKKTYKDFSENEETFRIPVLRWGGSSSLTVNLMNNIGPYEERKGTPAVTIYNGAVQNGTGIMRMGPGEYLQMMYENNPGMKLVPCPSPFQNTPEEIEQFAHFLLDEKDESEWGALRAEEYGIEKPVDVWYWELGNEVDWSIGGVQGNLERAEWYIGSAKSFAEAIRKVDPDAKICVCGPTAPWRKGWKMWHQAIMPELASVADAISFHPYFDGYSTESCFKYMDIIKRDIDSYVAEQDIRDENGNLKDIKILSTEGARFYGYNESYSYPGSMDYQSAVYTSHWLNNCFQHDYFIGNMYHNLNSAIFCWSLWHIDDSGKFYHSTIEKMYKLYSDYLGDRILGTDWSFYGTGKPTAPGEDDDLNGDKVYLSNDLYKWSTVFDQPDEPFISNSFSVLASGKDRDEITLFLCNRQMYRDLDINFKFNNDYTLVEEAVFTAPNMTTFSFSDESEALTKTVVTEKNEPNFSKYHMKGLSVVVLKLKTKAKLALTADEAANGTGADDTAAPELDAAFGDTENHWAKNEIAYMKEQGIVSGVAEGKFMPDRAITNAEAAAMTAKALKLDGSYSGSAFWDISGGEWYADFANNLYMNGLVRRKSFNADKNVTIAELIELGNRICRKYGLEQNREITSLGNVPEEYVPAAREAAGYGFISRLYENGQLDYTRSATRAEAVLMLYNIFRKL